MKIKPVLLAASLALSLLAHAPSAWAFRCNSYVIDAGLHKAEVLKKCGPPSTQDARLERRIIRVREYQQATTRQAGAVSNSVEVEREIQVSIEEWVYNFGPQQFMQLLIFEDGRLKTVQDLGYGS
ncbi:DUF2845 domain-containing protein [Paucibacter sp. B2R-40]|uniref:DUF2845 domain-containing protein n=1 Tax=Paucibacter sp. B2R-40 TaxID=2893554 RepID=UPI0021E39AF1|nr:DUF2845 domain-containing protein [Paucibacter sp. B2R-40]MCV2352663.1 DUF2845 domain-containing protein [Paucibacter sp. B2R-40]